MNYRLANFHIWKKSDNDEKNSNESGPKTISSTNHHTEVAFVCASVFVCVCVCVCASVFV